MKNLSNIRPDSTADGPGTVMSFFNERRCTKLPSDRLSRNNLFAAVHFRIDRDSRANPIK
jgi:hypothetical protein